MTKNCIAEVGDIKFGFDEKKHSNQLTNPQEFITAFGYIIFKCGFYGSLQAL